MKGMQQRCWEHDYCAPCYYLITVVTAPRRECLGALCAGAGGAGAGAAPATEPGSVSAAAPAAELAAPAAFVQLSAIGEVVLEVWRRTSTVYATVEACECVIMPDHFHGILRVKERLKRPMGHIVKAFKGVSRDECRSRGLLLPPNPVRFRRQPLPPNWQPLPPTEALPAAELWEEGFQDSILLRRGQLKAMVNYIADNPRRLAVKRTNPELFTVVRQQQITPDRTCTMIGNRYLLDHPLKRQIQISRTISAEALAAQKEELLYAAEHGTVLVSPCISPGEKEIARAVMEAGRPLIALLENGFSPCYRPPGRYFDACADGRLLMIAPFPYHRRKRTITREQCLALNEWARVVAG